MIGYGNIGLQCVKIFSRVKDVKKHKECRFFNIFAKEKIT